MKIEADESRNEEIRLLNELYNTFEQPVKTQPKPWEELDKILSINPFSNIQISFEESIEAVSSDLEDIVTHYNIDFTKKIKLQSILQILKNL